MSAAARPIRPSVLVAVGTGGALGTLCRYATSRAIHVAPGSFPWSTFTVNVVGAYLLGVLATLVVERWPPTRYVRPFGAIGFLGGFTTFSTLVVEGDLLVKDGAALVALGYVLASLVVGMAAVFLGVATARARFATRGGAR